ncbi:2-phosphosulfolactate phosphatase [Nocardia sp. NPDC058114]|uniref:2-phosphosulfolactate phosphatase n=1 Tax=Nocardia sp. NPDC058114 TaxID=3346346 RepID=UPI0036D7B478
MVDLFRATSTLQVLADSGHEISIATDPEEAQSRISEGFRGVGEWGGVTPAGFTFGNSPRRVMHLPVAGPPVVFLSSNGAGAIRAAAKHAKSVLIGNLWNLHLLREVLTGVGGSWLLVPAGLRGQPCLEDDFVCSRLAAEVGVAVPGLREDIGLPSIHASASTHLPEDADAHHDIDFILSSSYRPTGLPTHEDGLIVSRSCSFVIEALTQSPQGSEAGFHDSHRHTDEQRPPEPDVRPSSGLQIGQRT